MAEKPKWYEDTAGLKKFFNEWKKANPEAWADCQAWEDFKTEYKKANTWGEGDVALESLTTKQLKKWIEAHELVNETTGLDMRQEHYLASAKAMLGIREKQVEGIEIREKRIEVIECNDEDCLICKAIKNGEDIKHNR